jgi:hypothetical protein
VAQGPLGVRSPDGYLQAYSFIYQNGFYYEYLDPAGQHCEFPSQDDTQNCFVAPVPAGYTPFIQVQYSFYRRPATYDGPDTDAVDFLAGGVTPGWPGVGPYSRSCGFEGLHWWSFADLNWALGRSDTLGLFAPYAPRQLESSDPTWLAEKAHVPYFRQNLDFTGSPAGTCDKPPHFDTTPDRRLVGGARYTFYGFVEDEFGNPVPNAVVRVGEFRSSLDPSIDNTPLYWATTDLQGRYEVETRYCLKYAAASAFGYDASPETPPTGFDPANCPLPPGTYPGPNLSILRLAPAGPIFPATPPFEPQLLNPTVLDPPSTRVLACRGTNGWVIQP